MSEVRDQDKVAAREQAARLVAGAEGAAAGGAVGAGLSLIAVLASSTLGTVVPVLGTSVGGVIGAAVASWIMSKRKREQGEKDRQS